MMDKFAFERRDVPVRIVKCLKCQGVQHIGIATTGVQHIGIATTDQPAPPAHRKGIIICAECDNSEHIDIEEFYKAQTALFDDQK